MNDEKWCRFIYEGMPTYGLVNGDFVTVVAGGLFDQHRKVTDRRVPLESVHLLAPIIPANFYAVGSNYANHVIMKGKGKLPDSPKTGYRASSALTGPYDPIVKPRDAGDNIEYEGELVAVIGKKMKGVSPEEAEAGIFGWTIGNDLTERDWQNIDSSNLRGKNTDTFKPMGPWIVRNIDFKSLVTEVRVNGKTLHKFSTANMLFSPGEVISRICRTNTVYPGDIVWLGTDEKPETLRVADVVEVAISQIGSIRNEVILEGATGGA